MGLHDFSWLPTCLDEPTFLALLLGGPLLVCSDFVSLGPVSIINFVPKPLCSLLWPHPTDHHIKEHRIRAQRVKKNNRKGKKESQGTPLTSYRPPPPVSCPSSLNFWRPAHLQGSTTTFHPGAVLKLKLTIPIIHSSMGLALVAHFLKLPPFKEGSGLLPPPSSSPPF